MAVSIAGTASNPNTSHGSYSIVSAGNILIIFMYSVPASTPNYTVSDSKANVWTQIGSTLFNTFGGPSTSPGSAVFMAQANSAGNTNIQFLDGLFENLAGFLLIEYAGLGIPNVVDVVNQETGQTFGSATNQVTVPTIQNNFVDVIVSCIVDTNGSGTITAGTGFTVEVVDTNEYAVIQDNLGSGQGNRPSAFTPGGATLVNSDQNWNSHIFGLSLQSGIYKFPLVRAN